MSRVESTLLCLALVCVITLAAYTDALLVAVVVLIAQFMIAAAPAPSDESGRRINCPRLAPALLVGVIATVFTVFPRLFIGASGTTAGSPGFVSSGLIAGVVPGLAVGVFAAVLAQMLRRDDRTSLVLSLSYAVALCVFVVLPVGWIGAAQSLGGAPTVAVGAIAVAVSLLVWLIPGGRVLIGCLAVVAAGVVAAVSTIFIPGPESMVPAFGAAVGAGVAMFAILGQVFGRAWSQSRGHSPAGWGFAGAMSIAFAAPVVFVGSQFLGTVIVL